MLIELGRPRVLAAHSTWGWGPLFVELRCVVQHTHQTSYVTHATRMTSDVSYNTHTKQVMLLTPNMTFGLKHLCLSIHNGHISKKPHFAILRYPVW